jgi:hypothetical protein
MANASAKVEIMAYPGRVWQWVGDWNGLAKWSPGVNRSVSSGSTPGSLRTLEMANGSEIEEELATYDEANLTYTYKMRPGPIPVTNYLATVTVKGAGPTHCQVTWTATFDVDPDLEEQVTDNLTAMFQGSLYHLRELIEG